MAKIRDEYTIRTESGHYICSVLLDVNDGKEGYGIDFHSSDTSNSTSFGTSELADYLSEALFDALSNCCRLTYNESYETVLDRGITESQEGFDEILEGVFWQFMMSRFENQLVLCHEETGELLTNSSDFLSLIHFISEWSPSSAY